MKSKNKSKITKAIELIDKTIEMNKRQNELYKELKFSLILKKEFGEDVDTHRFLCVNAWVFRINYREYYSGIVELPKEIKKKVLSTMGGKGSTKLSNEILKNSMVVIQLKNKDKAFTPFFNGEKAILIENFCTRDSRKVISYKNGK